jgi:hypothetical protein
VIDSASTNSASTESAQPGPGPSLLAHRQLAWPTLDSVLAAALAEAAGSFARLDEALAGHPLQRAFLYRARLEAVRRQAAIDGQMIDPWHLAAVLEGLRLRMDHALRIIDRSTILAAAEHALTLHQWLVAPAFDEEGEVQRAEKHLAGFAQSGGTAFLGAAEGTRTWFELYSDDDGRTGGGTRPPIRVALVRFWVRQRLLREPVPLTGTAALRLETPWGRPGWAGTFLRALADEATDARQLLLDLERAWFMARAAVFGRRRDSHAAAAVDLLAATPLLSATTLAKGLGLAVKNAIRLLDSLLAAGVAVEVTHRSKRRLFGLKGMAPLADVVRPPYRPDPGRGRGRPPILPEERDEPGVLEPPAPPLPPLSPLERTRFDYSNLEAAMALADRVLSQTRRALNSLIHAPRSAATDGCNVGTLADEP